MVTISEAIKLMKTGRVVRFNGQEIWMEFDDNGDTVIEMTNGDIMLKDEFVNRFGNFKFAA